MKDNYRQVAAVIIKKDNTYLLAQKPRKDNAWQFPQGGIDFGETALQAAERELKEECGDTLEATFSETSIGSYSYDFPKDFKRHESGIIGAEVVFFSGIFQNGTVEVDNNEIIKALWLTKTEIQEKVSPEYWEIIKNWI